MNRIVPSSLVGAAPADTAHPGVTAAAGVIDIGRASVAGDLAAVDVQDLPGDVRRGLQEQHAVHHVADLAYAERGKLVAEIFVAFRRVLRGPDDAQRDGVDPDTQ